MFGRLLLPAVTTISVGNDDRRIGKDSIAIGILSNSGPKKQSNTPEACVCFVIQKCSLGRP
jgi:hypothetical protein